jgi:hypothetical protein
MLDTPLMMVEGEGMEMSNGNLKHPFREKQVNTQEGDLQGTTMDIETALEDARNQGEPHPPREDSATSADRPQAENGTNTTSRPKKMKLEAGNERQIERKRSRSRTAPTRKTKHDTASPHPHSDSTSTTFTRC